MDCETLQELQNKVRTVGKSSKMVIWSLIMDRFGPKWAGYRPVYNILRPTSLIWIDAMTIKRLCTCVTPFGPFYKPIYTARSSLGLPSTVNQTGSYWQLSSHVESRSNYLGDGRYTGSHSRSGTHSWVSSIQIAISEIQNESIRG